MLRIVGGGPAGAAAALAALGAGAAVEIYEQSPVPRHKVCGEFLSPEALPVLERLGVLSQCAQARPAQISRLILHVGSCEKRARLPATAWGLSRYRLDRILLEHAASLGARIISERRTPEDTDVVASGRPVWVDHLGDYAVGRLLQRVLPPESRRYPHLYGFKAHFRGEVGDTAELFFFQYGCVGVNAVEDGLVSVCGLVREHLLRENSFQPDALLSSRPEVAARVRPLSRATDWLLGGPVIDSEDINWRRSGPYLAGDALASIEPLTGAGIVNALLTGEMAGIAATRRTPVREYFRQAERVLGWPLVIGSALSAALDTGWARILAPVVPVGWLFRLTRPSRGIDKAGRSLG
jgi:hypothetical protein